jgi:AraC-like DNA-binding protein
LPLELRSGGDLTHPPGGTVRRGPALVSDVSISGPCEAIHTRQRLRTSDLGFCKIDLLVDGYGCVEQNDREASPRAGDFGVIEPSLPTRWALSAHRVIGLTFPRACSRWMPTRSATRRPFASAGTRVRGSICFEARGATGRQPESSGPAAMSRMATAVLDLLRAALAARLGRPEVVARETSQRSLQVRAHAFIEQELPYPEPSPATAAGADHLCMPYLYRLFESQRSSAADWIRQQRPERCRHGLLDPSSRATPVSSIGARSGLPNAGHFDRTFRNA